MVNVSARLKPRKILALAAWIFAFRKHGAFVWVLCGYWVALPTAASAILPPALLPLAFLSFCLLLHSGLYMLNQIIDLRYDRLHERKRGRPIASGEIPLPLTWLLSVALISSGLAAGFALSIKLGLIELLFLVVCALYSAVLKHILYVDLLLNTITHPLRVFLGIVLAGGNPMAHLAILVSASVYMWTLNAMRRLDELQKSQIDARPVLRQYGPRQLLALAMVPGLAWPLLLAVPSGPTERGLIASCALLWAAILTTSLWGSPRVRSSIGRLVGW